MINNNYDVSPRSHSGKFLIDVMLILLWKVLSREIALIFKDKLDQFIFSLCLSRSSNRLQQEQLLSTRHRVREGKQLVFRQCTPLFAELRYELFLGINPPLLRPLLEDAPQGYNIRHIKYCQFRVFCCEHEKKKFYAGDCRYISDH